MPFPKSTQTRQASLELYQETRSMLLSATSDAEIEGRMHYVGAFWDYGPSNHIATSIFDLLQLSMMDEDPAKPDTPPVVQS